MESISAHQGIIHKIGRLYFKDEREKEDLFQQILLNAWKSFPNFEKRSSFSTWLYRIALNTALMRMRNSKLQPGVALDEAAHSSLHAAADPSRSEDKKKSLYEAIDRLEDIEKSIIFLYLDGLNYKEMAEITGLSETHLGVKINRIKSRLKSMLGKGG